MMYRGRCISIAVRRRQGDVGQRCLTSNLKAHFGRASTRRRSTVSQSSGRKQGPSRVGVVWVVREVVAGGGSCSRSCMVDIAGYRLG